MFEAALQLAFVGAIGGAGFALTIVTATAAGLFVYRDRPGRRRRQNRK